MKDKNLFIITILCIIVLSFLSYKQFKNFSSPLPDDQIPDLKITDFESSLFPEEEGNAEFITLDGHLKIIYPLSWKPMPSASLEVLNQEVIKEGAKILLFVQKLDIKAGAFASLIVQELVLDNEKTVEEFVQEIQKETTEKVKETEIISLEIQDKSALLETKYVTSQALDLRSKEKIIILESEENTTKAYLITSVALDKDWANFEQTINNVFDSIQLNSEAI